MGQSVQYVLVVNAGRSNPATPTTPTHRLHPYTSAPRIFHWSGDRRTYTSLGPGLEGRDAKGATRVSVVPGRTEQILQTTNTESATTADRTHTPEAQMLSRTRRIEAR